MEIRSPAQMLVVTGSSHQAKVYISARLLPRVLSAAASVGGLVGTFSLVFKL